MGADESKLADEDIDFLCGHTSFSKREIKEWYKGFKEECPDGKLSKERFLKIYGQFFQAEDAEEFFQHVFRTFDKDNSGYINFKEFLIAINLSSTSDVRVKLNWMFTMYDVDDSGFIDKEEMSRIVKVIYDLRSNEALLEEGDTPESRTEKLFKVLDTNQDNQVSKQEFVDKCVADPVLANMILKGQKG